MRRHLIFTLLFALVFALTGCKDSSNGAASSQPTVAARVIEAGTIRAAYAIYEPLCMRKDDGELDGVGVDILEDIARRLELDIEWTEEVGWGTIFEGLQSNRYDVFGVGVWQNASRSRAGIFSDPFLFNAIKVWGLPNESRYTALDDLNQSSVRISTQDGAMDDLIAKSDFPAAMQVSMPQLSPWTDILLNITTGKADVTFAEPSAVYAFLRENPGALVELFPNQPVRTFPNCFAMAPGAFQFKSMIDSALAEMHNDGTIERILQRYENQPNDFFRVAPGYLTPDDR